MPFPCTILIETSAAGSALAKGKGTPAASGGKKTPAASAGNDTPSTAFPEFDPENPNKLKVTPDCASIELS